jgi:tRNA pseudouridine(38-40) synthase
MRLAVKFAYDGSFFHGSQRQSDDDPGSVEGRILAALRLVGAIPREGQHSVRISSRTDAGVSALGNVLSVDTEMSPDELLPALNANLEGIWCLGYAAMRDAQNVRWANARWYRYHLLPGTVPSDRIGDLNEVLSVYIGNHDFVHLSRRDEERGTETLIEQARASDLSGSGELVVIDLIGSRFLWNQVRRMVGAALRVLSGEMERSDLEELLSGAELDARLRDVRDRVPTMPPTGLVLMDVVYKDLEFIPHQKALELACRRSEEDMWRSTVSVLIGSALRSMVIRSGPTGIRN